MSKLDILAFGPHPDDVELFCAGTLLSHIAQGKKVGIIDLTRGELGTRGNAETRKQEAINAAKIIGVTARENLELADGFFQNDTESKLKVIQILRKYQPEIVLASTLRARHPDHERGGKLVAECCFLAGLRKIETFGNNSQPQAAHRPKALYHYLQNVYVAPDFVVDISPFMPQKIEAVKAYTTQFYNPNVAPNEPTTYISTEGYFDSIRGRAAQLGLQIGVQYAEGFTFSRLTGVKNLFDLI